MRSFFGKGAASTQRQEWLGLVCAFTWFFCSMFSYYEPFFLGTWTVLLFILLLCLGLAVSAVLWERQSVWTGRILIISTILGAICTGLIPFMPFAIAAAIYWLSALIMAPLLCRRLYGILMTARDGIRIRTYISTVSATIVIQMVWALLPLPYSIKFPVLSVFALLGLYGSAACLPEFKRKPLPGLEIIKFRSRRLLLIAVLILLVLLNLFDTIIHTYVITGAMEESDLFSLLTWGIVPLSFLLFLLSFPCGKSRRMLP